MPCDATTVPRRIKFNGKTLKREIRCGWRLQRGKGMRLVLLLGEDARLKGWGVREHKLNKMAFGHLKPMGAPKGEVSMISVQHLPRVALCTKYLPGITQSNNTGWWDVYSPVTPGMWGVKSAHDTGQNFTEHYEYDASGVQSLNIAADGWTFSFCT